MIKPNGAILYRGPSLLDGAPIVAIVTGLASTSANAKTGAMLQTWIIRDDVAPTVALKTGQDASVCGNCKHRPISGGSCYVLVHNAPTSIYKALHRGIYPVASDIAALGDGRAVRLGSYGDPAAVPVSVWNALVSRSTSHTGYTHQWQNPVAQDLQSLCMASADSATERDTARANGWRTFRVRTATETLGARESVCPASAEAGFKTNCATCGACSGADGKRGSIAIVVHGSKASRFIPIAKAA